MGQDGDRGLPQHQRGSHCLALVWLIAGRSIKLAVGVDCGMVLSEPQPAVCRRMRSTLQLVPRAPSGRSGEWGCPGPGTGVMSGSRASSFPCGSVWADQALGSPACGCGSLRMQRCCRLCRCALSSSSCFFLASSWVTMQRSHRPALSLGTGEVTLRQTLVPYAPLPGHVLPFPAVVHGPPGMPPAEGLAFLV